MANKIIMKNSSTASAVPVSGDLTQGELAVNVTDKKLYTKDSGGNVVEITPTNATNATNATNVTGTTTASIPTTALATGTASSSTVLFGDRTWGELPSSGGVTSLNGETGVITNTDTNAIGSYFAGYSSSFADYWDSTTQRSPGGTVAGSTLRNTTYGRSTAFDSRTISSETTSAGYTGTWRVMSGSKAKNDSLSGVGAAYLFVRIS